MRSRPARWSVALLAAATVAAAAGSFLGCGGFGDTGLTTGTVPVLSSSSDGVSTGSPSTPAVTGGPSPVSTTAPAAVATTELSRAQQILDQMTLRQKAAQTLLLTFEGTDGALTPSTQLLLSLGPPGGLLLLGRNVAGSAQLEALTTTLQDAAAHSAPGVGLFVAVDQEGGSVQRIHSGLPRLPAARKLAEESTLVNAQELATQTASGLLALGVNMNLAPVADVVSDTASFLYNRSFSGDPTVVIDYVEAVVMAFEREGLISVVKHFPGHGSASGDPHSAVVTATAGQADFAKTHLRPFKAAFAAGVEGVMVGHFVASAYDGGKVASSSSRVVTGLLRDGLGYGGMVVADDIQMAGAAGPSPADAGGTGGLPSAGEIAVRTLAAGCDLVICSGEPAEQLAVLNAIVDAVEAGHLDEARLDDAVLRMLEIKLRHGLVAR